MTLWQIDIYPGEGQADTTGESLAADARELGFAPEIELSAARGYLVQGTIDREKIDRLADRLFADTVVESTRIGQVGEANLNDGPDASWLVHVLPKPGVMDPVAQSAQQATEDFDADVAAIRTFRKYWVRNIEEGEVHRLANKLLANDSIESVTVGPLNISELQLGQEYELEVARVPLRSLDDDGLMELSRTGQLYLTLVEMQTIQKHFQELDRDPTDIELESVAQTWSEHCSHKTLAGRIAYRDEERDIQFENMLKETIFAATVEIRESLGDDDWCVSVFKDNAGIVRFDDEDNVVFKVETHNHPSALEPYGGANTGIGGVIRDPLGTGLGAKPVCNTDVFCFAPPTTPLDELPAGVLHPKRVMKGVVSGVRDYGNRMGIPTVNGAIYFDDRYLGNPLVYCGNVGLIPCDKSDKRPLENDWIVAIGGRTGRDGIHGATFSSAELTSESETLSGGAVQIGNAITEKMVLDVILKARDQGLYNAITDCGAGGFSSAVGEMGEDIGAEVWLEKAPLKYDGLSYTEIWISEAQERMVLSVSDSQWQALRELCESEGVEATIIGKFVPTGNLELKYDGNSVGLLSMEFLHNGRPPVIRDAVYQPKPEQPLSGGHETSLSGSLHKILGSLNVASKEWVIRQYDHEVQGGSVIKPLVGLQNDGPSDAAVIRPKLSSMRGLAISCGMNPCYGDFDTYHMAASAIDEAMRNCVAVGADPSRVSILDNFCWGYTDRPETLGSLVRAALACKEVAVGLGTPFISGKDSLNNEFSYDENGERKTIAIPSSLLISAMGQVEDVRNCVTMDLKGSGNALYVVGRTFDEMGGSHFAKVNDLSGGAVPRVNVESARETFRCLHNAIVSGTVRACHDASEGGLAVTLAEMAFAGGLGVTADLKAAPLDEAASNPQAACFSESNTRFVCEVPPGSEQAFKDALNGVPCARIGEVTDGGTVKIRFGDESLVDESVDALRNSWKSPLDWD